MRRRMRRTRMRKGRMRRRMRRERKNRRRMRRKSRGESRRSCLFEAFKGLYGAFTSS